jgi:hypothetical protein
MMIRKSTPTMKKAVASVSICNRKLSSIVCRDKTTKYIEAMNRIAETSTTAESILISNAL